MTEEIDILKLVCDRLDKAGISYMLTGSMAANFYAVPRMTRDIDIVVEIFECNGSQFDQIFDEDFYVEKESILDAIKHKTMFNIIHNKSVLKIDFVVRKETAYRQTEFQRRRKIDLDGMQIWVVAPEDLIISKLLWAKDSLSDFQLRDVRNILTSVKDLDEGYLRKWIQTLELTPIYEKVKLNG